MDRVEDIVGRLRGRNERFQSYGGMSMYYGGGDSILDCDAADLIQSQQAIIEEMREALEMVLSDCKCTQDQYDRNGPQWTSPTGHEYADMSYLLGKCEEISEIARKALSQKE